MKSSSPSFRPVSPADMSSSPALTSFNSARNAELGVRNPQFTQFEHCLQFFREWGPHRNIILVSLSIQLHSADFALSLYLFDSF
jgi:hypothetical protein